MTALRAARALAVLCVAALACGDRAARAPSPTWYEWPERLDYRVQHVAELQRASRAVERSETRMTLRLRVREAQYLLGYDSVLRLRIRDGRAALAPLLPEDTLAFYVGLGRRGELAGLMPACDPAVAACAAALPSTVLLELRRIIPALPAWMAPALASWEDTLRFDDAARPFGSRGQVITRYGPVRDTTVHGVEYWMVGWHSRRTSFRRPPGGAGFAPDLPTEEDGLTLIDKQRLVPAFSTWVGVAAAPPALRAAGIDASAFRARTWLVGTPFDSVLAGGGP